MMTSEATPPAEADAAVRVPWPRLKRNTAHRTSAPTNAAVRAEVWAAQQARNGDAPMIDAVILAALRMASRDREGLLAEIGRIEGESFAVDADKK